MLKQKLHLFFRIHKEKIYIGLIAFLLLLVIAKNGKVYYLEKIEEISKMPITTVESSDLFNQSIPWVLEPGQDGKKLVTYRTPENSEIKEEVESKELLEVKEQKEKVGTLDFQNYKVQIQNNISDYIDSIVNKKYETSLTYYEPLTTHNSPDLTKYNYENLFIITGNPRIVNTIPLYDHASSKALVLTTIEGEFEDKILGKSITSWQIYSLWNGSEFKILNPEYLSLPVKSSSNEKLVQGTNSSKSHYLKLEIGQFLLHFPNKILFNLDAKSTENVFFNKLKVEVVNKLTNETYYKGTIAYNDISQKAEWTRSVYKGKSGYKTTFWVPIDFKKEEFSNIYDKMYDKTGNFNLKEIQISVKPINDSDSYINYTNYKFNLDGSDIIEKVEKKENNQDLTKNIEENK